MAVYVNVYTLPRTLPSVAVHDPESLRKLLERKREQLTWEELRRLRQDTDNDNPAVEGKLWVLADGTHLAESTGMALRVSGYSRRKRRT